MRSDSRSFASIGRLVETEANEREGRFFIDKVATRLLVFQEAGYVKEVAGNWTIWQASQNVPD